jgi:rhamnosyltransferase
VSRSKPCDVPAEPVVVAVIPAFNPDEGLATLITQVAPQVAEVVVVDDGSISGLAVLDGLTGIRLVRQANTGVAGALNAGVQLALADLGADAVLTLDQDSGIPADYVARAVAAWQSATAAGIPVALVCAKSYSGRPTPTRGRVDGFAQAFDPMQSGSLVPASTYRDVGFYDEALVVDAVDSEFTVRCLEAGLAPIVGPGCDLEHGQGDRRPVRLLGRDWGYNRHSPERVYYMARNGTVLTRRHLRHEPGWVLRRLTEEGKAHVLRLTFSPDRAQVAAAAMAGLRDGLRGRTGRRP